MKKGIRLLGVMMAAALVCTACSKKTNVDSTKWIDNLADGETAAQQQNKKIILFFSADDQDKESADLKARVFNTDEFLTNMTPKYVLVNLDFSNSRFDQAQSDKTATKADKAAAAKIEKKLRADMKDATFYNVQSSPAFFLLTKEGYVVMPITVESSLAGVTDFSKLLEDKDADIQKYDAMLKATGEGSSQDKIKAIDALFEATDPQQRYLLSDLSRRLISLDKKNTSGFVGKHVLACANAEAMDAYLDNNPEKASQSFAKAGKDSSLTADEKQQAYYTAGYLLGQSGSTDYKSMKKYFQAAYDAKPDSEHAAQVKQMITVVDNMEQQAAEEKATQAAAKSGTGATSSEPVVGPQEKPADTTDAAPAPAPAASTDKE